MLNSVKNIGWQRNKGYLLIIAIALYGISITTQKFENRKLTKANVVNSLQQYVNEWQNDFSNLCKHKLYLDSFTNNEEWLQQIATKPYSILVFNSYANDSLHLVKWNNKNYYYTTSDIYNADTSYLTHYASGYYIIDCKKIIVNNTYFLATAIIPLKCNFSTKSSESEKFIALSNANYYYDISNAATNLVVTRLNGNPLFYLKKTQAGYFYKYSDATIFIRLLSILVFLFYINYVSNAINNNYGFKRAFVFLISSIIALRALSYFVKFPFDFAKLALFDPSIYASSFLHPSLGDLLINNLLLYWIISFYSNHFASINKPSFSFISNKIFSILLIILYVFISLILRSTLKSLVIDSKIPFDVINFFSLNIFTAVAFIIIGIAAINYYKLSKYVISNLAHFKTFNVFQLVVSVSFFATLFFVLFYPINQSSIVFRILSVIWLLVFAILLFNEIKSTTIVKNAKNILSLFWILFFTASFSGVLMFYQNTLEIEQRKQMVEEIFLQNNFDIKAQQNQYSFAIYTNKNLVKQSGSYLFPTQFTQQPPQQFVVLDVADNSELIYTPDAHTTIVALKPQHNALSYITLFAYLFFSLLIVVFLILFIETVAYLRFTTIKFDKIFSFNIQSQIRGTIILISVASFIAVEFASIYFYINKFKIANNERINNALNISSEQVEDWNLNGDFVTEITINKFAKQHKFAFNLFNNNGELIAASNPIYYNRQIINKQISSDAYNAIYIDKRNLFSQKENIGSLQFNSTYKSIEDEDGNVIACLNLPDINNKINLQQELSSFISSLININAFIFLIAGAIAYLITNRITASFTLIRNKMKAINWQSGSEHIEWKRDDEIGALVKEYNTMVTKLDETAKAFASSQKEIAWKEMAKQVAHEIKNPLTPMKLSIQYLQNKIEEDAPNIKQLSTSVANTLIEQINQLANIAGDFSQFANITNSNPETIDINELILSLVKLYATDSSISIEHNLADVENYVHADKTQLLRLFTNIIKNAIEACGTANKTVIEIKQQRMHQQVLISIKDNGTGIPIELQPKIFSINFTTKSSGTGLGLAICKGIVENANGKIWFTSNNNGTTFFIELPLVDR